MTLERHPLVYRNLLTLPAEIKEKVYEHIAHGSWAADAAESEKIHASIMQLWLERGLTAFMSDDEDEESATYLDFYLGVLSAFARARTSASERIHADSPLSFLLYGPGRQSDERQGYQKNPRMVPQAAKQPLEIKTVWATASHAPVVVNGKLQPFKVEVPPDSDYQPLDRADWPSEDEG